ncbi:MAG TPA: rRNA maturation RNase YbeY [Pyrinomonadaceae bacterium]|nr:rRNA maturation RNase YbeY [Pyrinomonadaceae bacterium]
MPIDGVVSGIDPIGNGQLAMVEIINRQRKHRVNLKKWRGFSQRAIKSIGTEKDDVSIVFVSNAAIRKLNRQYRGKDCVTDVLSFPSAHERFENQLKANLGEVVISLERAATQSKENGLTIANEVEQLILHGLLHLCGYDHASDNGEMDRLELRLRRKLGI